MTNLVRIPGSDKFFADKIGRIWKNKNGRVTLQKAFIDSNGYQRVNIPLNNVSSKHYYVQRLVCEAFKGITNPLSPICIRKAPKQQPRRIRKSQYLMWGKTSDIKRNGGRKYLSSSIVKEIRRKYSTGKFTQAILAKEYGMTQANISYMVNMKIYND
jgi:hypothetical protein